MAFGQKRNLILDQLIPSSRYVKSNYFKFRSLIEEFIIIFRRYLLRLGQRST